MLNRRRLTISSLCSHNELILVCVRLCVSAAIENMKIDDITYQIRGAIFEVNKVLGSGFMEKVYENALLVELKKRGLKAEAQVPIKITYKEETVGDYWADIIVADQVIIELKAVDQLQKVHEAQILNYLHATGISKGLLVNFRYPKAEIRRFVI